MPDYTRELLDKIKKDYDIKFYKKYTEDSIADFIDSHINSLNSKNPEERDNATAEFISLYAALKNNNKSEEWLGFLSSRLSSYKIDKNQLDTVTSFIDDYPNVDINSKLSILNKGKKIKTVENTNNIKIDLNEEIEEKVYKTIDGFIIPSEYKKHDKNIGLKTLSDIYNNITDRIIDEKSTNNELIEKFNNTCGIRKKSSNLLDIEFNSIKNKNINDLSHDEIAIHNIHRESLYAKITTAETIAKAASIYKSQYDKHYNKPLITRFFQFFSKENREERENIKKMENYFKSIGLDNDSINAFKTNKEETVSKIANLSNNKRILCDGDLKEFFINKEGEETINRNQIEVESAKNTNLNQEFSVGAVAKNKEKDLHK